MELSRWSRTCRGVSAGSEASAGAHCAAMGSGRGGCAERAGAQSSARIGSSVPEGSGGYTSQHTRTFYPAVEGTGGAGSRLWACARRIVLRRPREIKTGQERTSCTDEKDRLRSKNFIDSFGRHHHGLEPMVSCPEGSVSRFSRMVAESLGDAGLITHE